MVVDYWGRLLINGQVDASGPPIFILHGTNDQTVDYDEAAVVLASEADAVGLPFSFYTIQDGPHGFGAVNPDRVSINGQTPLTVTIDFIEDHLFGNNPLYETQTITRGLSLHRCNRFSDCDGPLRFFQVKQFGHLAVYFKHALSSIGRVSGRLRSRHGLGPHLQALARTPYWP